jgi:hypothetical protein
MSASLSERIRRGQEAIARAKAEGRDVQEWEAHLEKLKHNAQADNIDDPLLSPEQWYPSFREFHHAVVRETTDFDCGELRERKPDLHRQIKCKESEIDALGTARLSEIMALMREWRRLILQAELERRERQSQEP